MDVLLVVDLQNDFVDGALGNEGNDKIVGPLEKLVEGFKGEVVLLGIPTRNLIWKVLKASTFL